jgi:hypothetical protein
MWYARFIDSGALLPASALTLAGVVLLFLAWRRRERSVAMLAVAWALIAVSYRFWARAAGFDSGATIGTVLLMVAAIIFVLINGEWRSKSPQRAERDGPAKSALEGQRPEPGRGRRALLRLLAAGPLAFLAGLGLSMLIVAAAPWSEADRIVLGACLLLILWPVAMVWSCATHRPQRSALALAAIAVLSACGLVPLTMLA